MKLAALPPLVIDADPWLRRCGLPYWALAQFRALRVGEFLLLVDFEAPGLGFGQSTSRVAVTLTRERGSFRLEAVWLAHLGKNSQRRGHLWWWASFKLRPGRRFELVQEDSSLPHADSRLRSMAMVALVMRRASMLARWARHDGDRASAAAMDPDFFMGRRDTESGALGWLEKLRGPALSVSAP